MSDHTTEQVEPKPAVAKVLGSGSPIPPPPNQLYQWYDRDQQRWMTCEATAFWIQNSKKYDIWREVEVIVCPE